MKKKSREFLDILFRYSFLVLTGFFGLNLLYSLFNVLTLYPSHFLINLFFDANLNENLITVSSCFPIEIVGACIAGAAYYLLLILNLATPKINLKKRLKLIVLSFLSFLVLNLIRIFLLSLMFISNSSFFDITHKLFWYFGSTLFVVIIWFAQVKIFKIKDIPFYSDLKFLYKNSLLKRK
ncbi:MAG: pacearchaeosortase [Nanoarchaeota archaeon]|nr:pacearchaeosortase [Nanoarchaeota archaeon]